MCSDQSVDTDFIFLNRLFRMSSSDKKANRLKQLNDRYDGWEVLAIMKIKTFLDQKLKADLSPITHESLNFTFVGYSSFYEQSVFVKVFAEKRKLDTERAVNLECNHRVLQAFQVPGSPIRFALVMKDITPEDLPAELSVPLAFNMGKVLADFHTHVQPFENIKTMQDSFGKIGEDVDGLKDRRKKEKLDRLLTNFSRYQLIIQKDLLAHANVVLHGDVGVRNYKMVAGKLALIDYEKARLGPVYLDFIKLFYQDFKLDSNLIQAFLKGYRFDGATFKINPLTQTFLIYTTSVGIAKYTDKIRDDDFKAVGDQMISTVAAFFSKEHDLVSVIYEMASGTAITSEKWLDDARVWSQLYDQNKQQFDQILTTYLTRLKHDHCNVIALLP